LGMQLLVYAAIWKPRPGVVLLDILVSQVKCQRLR
jgi:hypothetical protein